MRVFRKVMLALVLLGGYFLWQKGAAWWAYLNSTQFDYDAAHFSGPDGLTILMCGLAVVSGFIVALSAFTRRR